MRVIERMAYFWDQDVRKRVWFSEEALDRFPESLLNLIANWSPDETEHVVAHLSAANLAELERFYVYQEWNVGSDNVLLQVDGREETLWNYFGLPGPDAEGWMEGEDTESVQSDEVEYDEASFSGDESE